LEVRELIRHLAQDKAVLLSTHVLQEVEAVAHRIVIINGGRIVGDGTPAELQQRTQGHERVLLIVAAPRAEVEAALRNVPQVLQVRCPHAADGFTHFEIDAAPGAQLARQLGLLVQANGWQLEALSARPPTLEEAFLALTEPQDSVAT
jgi:ABC-2 type transport system ATP-binding protein